MGVTQDCNMLILRGKNKTVDKISVHDISLLSKYSVNYYALRYADENDKTVNHSTPIMHIYYPETPTLEIITEDDYHIKTSADAEFWTLDGWKKAGELKIDDMVWTNGIDVPPYQDKDTLKRLYYDEHLTQKQIADRLGCKERTIRYYIHLHGLEKGIAGKSIGEKNGRWTGDNVTTRGGYERTHEQFNALKTGICSRCGRELPTQLHHVNRDTTNLNGSNIVELCDLCHAMEHHGYVIKWVRPARITEIRNGGMFKTYGERLKGADNVIIEGFIVRFNTDGADTIREFDG